MLSPLTSIEQTVPNIEQNPEPHKKMLKIIKKLGLLRTKEHPGKPAEGKIHTEEDQGQVFRQRTEETRAQNLTGREHTHKLIPCAAANEQSPEDRETQKTHGTEENTLYTIG